jgi:hypothetical protein
VFFFIPGNGGPSWSSAALAPADRPRTGLPTQARFAIGGKALQGHQTCNPSRRNPPVQGLGV